jgi:hypothetical protein
MGTGKRLFIWMRLRVVPRYFLGISLQLVSIVLDFNSTGIERETLLNGDPITIRKRQFLLQYGYSFSAADQHQR